MIIITLRIRYIECYRLHGPHRKLGIYVVSVPCRPGILVYMLQDKTRRRVCIHTLPRALQPRTLPPYRGGLRCCHVPYGSGPRLPIEVGSGVVTCPTAPGPASLVRWALALKRTLWLWTPPPCRDGLRRCHVTYGSTPHLPIEVGFDVAAYPMAPDPASQPGRVLVLPWIPQFPKGHMPQIYKERPSWPTYVARLTCF
jgi:hypothetical protein